MTGQINLFDEIIIDNFAGGGGASTGIELALGRPVTIAINHDPAAILMHKTNHPHTLHLQASVWDVDPVEVCGGASGGAGLVLPGLQALLQGKRRSAGRSQYPRAFMLAAGYVDVSCAGSPEDEKAVEIIRKAIAAMKDLEVCRNELCLYCGLYISRHLGACDGCRWLEPPKEDKKE